MATRIELQTALEALLGSNNVYYQPPESIKLSYPAIIYSRKEIVNIHADNSVYGQSLRYEITVIDKNPDSEIVMKVSRLTSCKFDRHFKSDNLNHDVFTIYY